MSITHPRARAIARFIYQRAQALAIAYIVLCATLMLFQRSLIYYPQPAFVSDPASVMSLAVPGANLQISTRDMPGPQALIYFGGNAEDVSRSLVSLSLAFPAHALYLMHYRGYGASTGSSSEEVLHADALALYDRVRARHPAVMLVGRSLGSGVAVRLAGQRPVSRLVLVTPYDSIQEVAAARLPWVPVRWLLRDRFESVNDAPRVTAPTLLIAAEHDEIISRRSTEKLLASFTPGTASLKVVPGTGHNDVHRSPLYLDWLRGD